MNGNYDYPLPCSGCGAMPDTMGTVHHNPGCPYGTSIPMPILPGDTFPLIPPRQGWMCPKCGNVYAPFIPECSNCNSHGVTTGDTNG